MNQLFFLLSIALLAIALTLDYVATRPSVYRSEERSAMVKAVGWLSVVVTFALLAAGAFLSHPQ